MAGEASKSIPKEVLWGGGRSPFSMSYGKMMMWFFLLSDALTFGSLITAMGFMKFYHYDYWPNSEEVFYHFPFVSHDVHLPLLYVAFMTFILIVSSVTMVLAVEAGHRMDKKGVVKWLALTVVGGFIFLGSQAWEWTTFILGNGKHSTAFELQDGNIAKLKFEDKHAHFEVGENPLASAYQAIDHGAKLQIKNGVFLEGAEAKEALKGAFHVSGANLKRNEYGHRLYADFFFGITGFHGFHVFSGVIINLIVLINVIRGVYHQRGHYEMVEKAGLYWHFVDLVWVFVFTFFYLV